MSDGRGRHDAGGFHIGSGWWFVREPGGFVSFQWRPGGGTAYPAARKIPVMTPETWQSVVAYVAKLDGTETDDTECLGPEGTCVDEHVSPCPLAKLGGAE